MTRAATGAAIFVLLLLPLSAAAQNPRILGGVNLDHYCKTIHGGNSGVMRVGDAWRCKKRQLRNGVAISVEHACRLQYGRNDLKARVRSSDNSWICFVPYYTPPS